MSAYNRRRQMCVTQHHAVVVLHILSHRLLRNAEVDDDLGQKTLKTRP
jgi:hypothetical protein